MYSSSAVVCSMHFNHILECSNVYIYPAFQCFPWTRFQFFFSFSFPHTHKRKRSCIVVYSTCMQTHTHMHITIQNICMNSFAICAHFPSVDLTLLKSSSIWKRRWNSIGTFSLYYNMFVSHGTFRIWYVQAHPHTHTYTHIYSTFPDRKRLKSNLTIEPLDA